MADGQANTVTVSDDEMQSSEPDLVSQHEAEQQRASEPDLVAQYEAKPQTPRPAPRPQPQSLDTVEHPSLGTLKFPQSMPYDERNSLIDEYEKKAQADQEISKLATPGGGQEKPGPVRLSKPHPFTGLTDAELEAGRMAASVPGRPGTVPDPSRAYSDRQGYFRRPGFVQYGEPGLQRSPEEQERVSALPTRERIAATAPLTARHIQQQSGEMVEAKDWLQEKGGETGANLFERIATTPTAEPFGSFNVNQPSPETKVELPPEVKGIVRGTGRFVGSMAADPLTYALLGLGPSGKLGRTLMSAGFAGQMGYGSIKSAAQLGAIWDRPDIPREQKFEIGTQAVLNTVMAGMAGAHAVKEPFTADHPLLNSIPPTDRAEISRRVNAARGTTPMPPGVNEHTPETQVKPTDTPGPRTEMRSITVSTGPDSHLRVATPVTRNVSPAEVAVSRKVFDETTQTMIRAAQSAQRASQAVQPASQAPPPEPSPWQQLGGRLSGRQLEQMAKTIATLPEEHRNDIAEDTHNNLAKWILDNGRVVINGKIHSVKTADEAEALAADILNEAVDRARAEGAKEQKQEPTIAQEPQPAAQTPRPTPAETAPVMQAFLERSRPTAQPPRAAAPNVETQPTAAAQPATAEPVAAPAQLSAAQPAAVPPAAQAPQAAPTMRPTSRVSEYRRELMTETDPGKRAELEQAIAREQAIAEGRPFATAPDTTLPPLSEVKRVPEGTPAPPKGIPPRGEAGRVNLDKLTIDPKRFQYKLNVNERGVTNLLSGRKWNEDLAGIISVWLDPKDGKLYVVNGHHRAQLAMENGVRDALVRHLDVDTAEAARARGALQNIAEGRGTAVDAAKFFRDSGITPEKLDEHGISLGEATAAKGLALSHLDPSIFEKVATGKISEGRGVAIGEATTDPAQQEAIVKLLDRREKQGKSITDATVAELARFVANSGNRTVEQGGLFGPNQQIHSLAVEKAEISAYIKSKLASERRVFGSVASETKAATLGKVEGQTVKAERNRRIAEAAAQAEEAYNKLSSVAGPINSALETAAKELVSGKFKAEDVKQRAYRAVRAEIQKALAQGDRSGSQGLQEPASLRALHEEAGQRQGAVERGQPEITPGNPPTITISRQSRDLIKQATGFRNFNGVNLQPGHARQIAEDIRALAPSLDEAERQHAVTLADSLERTAATAGDSGLNVVLRGAAPEVAREELIHSAQRRLGAGMVSRHIPPEAIKELLDHPVGRAAQERLTAEYGQLPEWQQVAEIAAKIASKQLSFFRSTAASDDVAGWMDWMDRYFTHLEQEHGPQSVADRFRETYEGAQKLYEASRERRTAATLQREQREGNAGIQPATAGPSAGRGEPGGQAEGNAAGVRENAGIERGDTVTLKSGQVGTVQFADPEMKAARVQLPNGETKTVPFAEITGSRNRSSEAGFARMNVPGTIATDALRRLLEPSEETKAARSVDDRLFELDKQYEADVLRSKQLLQSIATTQEDQEAIYHHLEDPNAPLTAEQQKFLDQFIRPMTDASREMRARLQDEGVPVESEGYVHRIVQNRPSPLSRATAPRRTGGKGNVLSTSASSLKSREMFTAVSEDGERVVIHRGDGKITGFRDGEPFDLANDKPRLKVGDAFFDEGGKEWTLQQATTKEIEQNTNLRYYKNALATSLADYLQLRRAERASQSLEALKSNPQFLEMAFHEKSGMPPDGWRPTTLPQFRGWYFEPRTAEVLERYAQQMVTQPYTTLDRIGNFMTASLLLNPTRHVFNIGNHWLVERGVSGNFNPFRYPKAIEAGRKALHAVMTQNEDFLTALDQGAPMMSHRQDLQQFHQKLYELLLDHLEKDHTAREKLAQFVGLEKQGFRDTGVTSTASRASGLRFLNNLRKLGQRGMWMSNDVFILQSSYEKMLNDPDLSFKEAMAQTVRHIPDYRLPDRVMDSPALATVMRTPLLTVFSRYHYGVWKSYGQMLRESFSPDSSMEERRRGLDHMAMLGLVTFGLYELWDKALKKITGDANARMVRSGASAVPAALTQVMQGKKEPGDLVTASLTPNPLLKTTAELAFNRDAYFGGHIFDPHDSFANIMHDVGMHFAGALGPVQQYHNAQYKDNPTRDFLFSQVGVSFPKYESRTRAQILMHDLMRDNMAPLSSEARRELDARRERIASGQLTPAERKRLIKLQVQGEFRYYLPHLSYQDIKRVYDAGTPEEKQIIKPIMQIKALHLLRRNPYEAEREGALDALRQR